MPPTGVRCCSSLPLTDVLPSTPASGSSASADLGTRFSAFVIDALLLFGLQWIVVIALSRQLQAVGLNASELCEPESDVLCEGPNTVLWIVLFAFIVITTFGYHAFFDGAAGATPGKRWMGLRVVDESGDVIGMPAGLIRSVIRQGVWVWVFLFVSASPISVAVPGLIFLGLFALSVATFVWGAFAPDGRALHDLAVGSRVETVTMSPASSKESVHDRV